MIWEPFLLALVLGLLVSAGLYFAYLWPSVEPLDDDDAMAADGASPSRAINVPDDPKPRPSAPKPEPEIEPSEPPKIDPPAGEPPRIDPEIEPAEPPKIDPPTGDPPRSDPPPPPQPDLDPTTAPAAT